MAVAVVATALVAVTPSASGETYAEGSDGSGDPFFPQAGNGGYDVRHYSLTLDYDHQPANLLNGRAVIQATATENLERFNLDLRDFYAVSSVKMNGVSATFTRPGIQELAISPRPKLKAGSEFVVEVVYSGQPEPITDPDESIEGWIPTDDGAFVVNEPQGSPGWYPVNDTPRDKATFDFTITVPAGLEAVANGRLISQTTQGGETTWVWEENSPMAPYLATATNGNFLTRAYSAGDLFMFDAVDPNTRRLRTDPPNPTLAFERLDPQPEIIDFLSDLIGTYPFTSGGGIIDWAPDVGYALEAQTRANYHRIPLPTTVVHEIAHQWFGNAVTIGRWPDIWLNEGFATFSEWFYDEMHGGPKAQKVFRELYAIREDDPDFEDLWFPAPAALDGPDQLFHTPVYDRGAMTLQALREKVGDSTFFGILRDWYSQNRATSVTGDQSVTTADFIKLAGDKAGQNLDHFFQVWLYEEGRPETW